MLTATCFPLNGLSTHSPAAPDGALRAFVFCALHHLLLLLVRRLPPPITRVTPCLRARAPELFAAHPLD